MLSQTQIKHIRALHIKKYREEFGQFIAEGAKLVGELIRSRYRINGIYANAGWIVSNLAVTGEKQFPVIEATPSEMERISTLATPGPVLAVVDIPPQHADPDILPAGLNLMLDDIRDPGNLGTIIRVADWFGVARVTCSETCVDLYNPKVVQATMGSLTRVEVVYHELAGVLSACSGKIPVYGTYLEGQNIYETKLPDKAIILVGNEAKGISDELKPFVVHKLFIPSFGNGSSGKAESLNASVATAIVCAEFRRQAG